MPVANASGTCPPASASGRANCAGCHVGENTAVAGQRTKPGQVDMLSRDAPKLKRVSGRGGRGPRDFFSHLILEANFKLYYLMQLGKP